MEGYHTSVTPGVTAHTFNPFLDAIGRVLQVLCSVAPAGTTIQINNRDLAESADLKSAGHIPRLLRQLEAQGYIDRVTTPQGSLIVVAENWLIPHADQSFSASQSDPDRDQADVTGTRDQPGTVIPHADPPTPPIRKKHDPHEQQQPRMRDLRLLLGETTADRDRPERVFPEQWRQIQAANPGYTAHDFMRELAIASGRPDVNDPVALVVGVRVRGEAVYPPKEPTHERPTRRRPDAPDRRQRPAAGRSPRPEQPPPLTRAYLQSRPRRGDSGAAGTGKLRDVPGGGKVAGG